MIFVKVKGTKSWLDPRSQRSLAANLTERLWKPTTRKRCRIRCSNCTQTKAPKCKAQNRPLQNALKKKRIAPICSQLLKGAIRFLS